MSLGNGATGGQLGDRVGGLPGSIDVTCADASRGLSRELGVQGFLGLVQAPQAPPRPKSNLPTSRPDKQRLGDSTSSSWREIPTRSPLEQLGSPALSPKCDRQYRTLCLVPVDFLTHVRASLHSPCKQPIMPVDPRLPLAPTPKPLRNSVHSFR